MKYILRKRKIKLFKRKKTNNHRKYVLQLKSKCLFKLKISKNQIQKHSTTINTIPPIIKCVCLSSAHNVQVLCVTWDFTHRQKRQKSKREKKNPQKIIKSRKKKRFEKYVFNTIEWNRLIHPIFKLHTIAYIRFMLNTHSLKSKKENKWTQYRRIWHSRRASRTKRYINHGSTRYFVYNSFTLITTIVIIHSFLIISFV